MSGRHEICRELLLETNNFLVNEKYIGRKARYADLLFIINGTWLKDTAVIEAINCRQGAWEVCLIFAHYKNLLQLLVRSITRCFSEQKAKAAAFYICKEAAKDRRGTLNVSIKDLDLCEN
ncbi:MAG: hypothetical protein ABI416_04145 [Ginsengibacter sp.]